MANSDIELLFGVATGGTAGADSEENIRRELDRIISDINKEPMQVKIEFNYDGQIEKLRSKLSGEKIDIGEVDLVSSDTTKALTEVTNNLKEINGLVREISNKKFGFDFNYTTGTDAVQTMDDYITKAEASANVVISLYKNIRKFTDSGDGVKILKMLGVSEGSEFLTKIGEFDEGKITKAIGSAGSIAKIQSVIRDLTSQIEYFEKVINKLNSQGMDIELVDKSGIDAAEEKIQSTKELGKQTQVEVTSMIKSALGGQAEAASTVAESVSQAVAPAQQMAEATHQAAVSAIEAKTAFDSTASSISDVAEAAKGASAGTDEIVESAERARVTEIERQNALKKSYELLTKMQEALKKWDVAGQSGAKTSDQYNNIQANAKSLSDLIEQYKSGGITLKEFNVQYAQLAASFAENSNKIKDAGEAVKSAVQSPEDKARELKYAYDMLAKMNAQMRSIDNATGGIFGDGADGSLIQSQYQSMSGYIRSIGDLIEEYKNGTVSADAFQEKLQMFFASYSECAASVSDYTSKMRDSLNTETQWQSTMKQTEVLLKKITDAQQKWTKAQTGSTSDEYTKLQDYNDRLLALKSARDQNTISLREYKKQLAELNAEFAKTSNVIHQAGEDTLSFSDRLGSIASKFTAWFSVSQIIMKATDAAKEMLDMAIEIDSAMTQLKIVTGATDSEVTSFLKESTRLAKELGKNISDVAASIETFSRLGYTFDEASKLAEYSTILSNTAAVDINAATTGITSIIKGYNLQVQDTEHVADVLIKVGQEYAVSAAELMEAFERSGAALNATNLSFEKSAGLIAAANAAVQDSSTVGTALKTISARIRGSKTDLEELGEETSDLADGFSKYANELKAITGFDIVVEGTTNQYKDLFEIFDGIGKAWDKLSDTQQARVAEILGGTRQLQVVSKQYWIHVWQQA